MTYDRYGTRNDPRDERSRWREDRPEARNRDRERDWRGGEDDRGFFERAGDEIASWFGDDDAERRREQDRVREGERGWSGRDRDDDRGRFWRERSWDRGDFERDEDRGRFFGRGRERFSERDRGGYRPMTGDYGRGEPEAGQFFAASGVPRGGFDRSQGERWRSDRRHEDPHYATWRQRHMDELDRDYEDYARENQSRFESEFGSWRERRQQKRGLLLQIREHMEVIGSDDQPVGTIDRIAGDRIILAKSDPESGGSHHSLSCSDIDRVEGDRVILDCNAEQARERWRDESRNRALFERDDQGEMGPRVLDRSFQGTYR